MKTLAERLKLTARKITNSFVPLALSTVLAVSGIQGCASYSKIHRPEPPEETAKYSSKYEESVMRDMRNMPERRQDRNYYAAIWNFTNSWVTPDSAKNKILSSLDSLSVLEDRNKVDSIIDNYFFSFNTTPGDSVNSFTVWLKEIADYCHNAGISHPNAIDVERYYDDIGLGLLRMVGVPIKKLPKIPPSRLEKRRGILDKRMLEDEVATIVIDWENGRGNTWYQEEMLGSGFWVYVTDEFIMSRTRSEKNPIKKSGLENSFVIGEKHELSQRPVPVHDEEKKLNESSVDPRLIVVFDPSDSSRNKTFLNYAIKVDDFIRQRGDTAELAFKIKYRLTPPDFGRTIFADSIVFDKVIQGYKKGEGGVLSFQEPLIFLPADRELRYVLGLDVLNREDEHYKIFIGRSTEKRRGDMHVGDGWLVEDSAQDDRRYIGGSRPLAFPNLEPGQRVNFMIQLPYTKVDNSLGLNPAHVRLRFIKKEKDDFPRGRVEILPLSAVGGTPIRQEQDIAQGKYMFNPLELVNNEKGFAIANFNLSPSTFNIATFNVPNVEEGNYRIVAHRISGNPPKITASITSPTFHVKNKKK
ncbi:hypothetical protein HYT23_05490 [Candidatus Pacearchaeota archaeon]|nr:hypothetical protein [Candidatus Pacearchaeota archaeon]